MRIVFFLFIVFVKSFSLENYNNSFSIPLRISVQRPILSPQNHFKLGFYKPATSSRVGDRWYLGIWYRRFGDVVVWVANRDTPLSKPNGTLEIFNNKLHLLDQYGNSVWSANGTSQSRHTLLTGELLDDGNFVLRYSDDHDSSRLFWQSFDYPTDTLLPGMKVGLDKKSGLERILRSCKGIDDPSSGDYIYKVEIRDLPESYIRSKGEPFVRIGPWNSVSDRDAIGNWTYFTNNFVENSEEISYSFSISNASFFSMLRMDYNGSLTRFIWSSRSGKMEFIYQNLLPNDACDMYNKCGPYGLCDINTAPVCSCMEGFQAGHQEAWERNITEKGCVRKTQQRCYGDRFVKLQTMKLPDTSNSVVNKTIGLKECKERCLNNCNCTAYANENMENGGSGCVIWLGELLDIRKYKNAGQDLYVRVEHIDTVFLATLGSIPQRMTTLHLWHLHDGHTIFATYETMTILPAACI